MTENKPSAVRFPAVCRKKITAAFDGGRISSDGGVMLPRPSRSSLGIAERLARVIRTAAIRTGSPICCPIFCAPHLRHCLRL